MRRDGCETSGYIFSLQSSHVNFQRIEGLFPIVGLSKKNRRRKAAWRAAQRRSKFSRAVRTTRTDQSFERNISYYYSKTCNPILITQYPDDLTKNCRRTPTKHISIPNGKRQCNTENLRRHTSFTVSIPTLLVEQPAPQIYPPSYPQS